jgi:hypothetical protein
MKDEKPCYVCNGERIEELEQPYLTHRCSKHNTCLRCGRNRSELKRTPWGMKGAFVCQSCEDNRINADIEAFQKEDQDDHDFDYRSDVKCRYCGHEFYPDDFHESGELDCYNCNSTLHVEIEWDPSYTITKPESKTQKAG